MSGNQIGHSQVQQTQAGQDAIATQSGNLAQQQQGITTKEVVALLEQLEATVKASGLSGDRPSSKSSPLQR